MNIKKINAILSLLLFLLLLIHIIYQMIAYIMFLYQPVVTKLLGYAVIVPMLCHAILSVINVLFLHDSRTILYKKANAVTCLQRISAVIMVLLLPAHVDSFSLYDMTAGTGAFFVSAAIQILFYAAVLIHVAASFSKSLVTLGLLGDYRKMKTIDRIMYAVCTVLFIVVSVVVTKTSMTLFGM